MGFLQNEFKLWQNSEIYTKKYGDVQIYDCIQLFVYDGIVPFINKHGYILCCNKEYICDLIATSLFYYSNNTSYLIQLPKIVNFNDEFYQYFTYTIQRDEWDCFWKYYNTLFNDLFFDIEGGFCVQIEQLMYALIDLEKSPTHIQYIKENTESESEDDTKNIDPYILDQRNRENHYKFTKFES